LEDKMHHAATHGIVFAAGLGKRLRPITEHTPKPLVAVGGATMLDRALDVLAAGGVTECVVNAAYLKEQIIAHCAARQGAPRLTLSLEDAPLETGGGVRQAWQHLKHGPFWAMNSDIVLVPGAQHPLARMHAAWHDGLDALLLVHPREKAVGYEGKGDFELEADDRLRFRQPEEAHAPYVFTGLQLLHPRMFADAPDGPYSLNVLYRQYCESAAPQRIGAVVHDGDWLHVGDPQGLADANAYFTRAA
jgi:N-acetyl-alpha-D-muramate 1-phosphate uridylyltransferase